MTKKKVFQSKANWPLAQVNKFEQVWGGGKPGGPHMVEEGEWGQGGKSVPSEQVQTVYGCVLAGPYVVRSGTAGLGLEWGSHVTCSNLFTWGVHLRTDRLKTLPSYKLQMQALINIGVRHLLSHLNHWIRMDPISVKFIQTYSLFTWLFIRFFQICAHLTLIPWSCSWNLC